MRYDVEWMSELPTDEFGDADFDRATYKVKHCETMAQARRVARGAAAASPLGCAEIKTVESITAAQAQALADLEGEHYWPESGFGWLREVASEEVIA
jgi:hypothetical protein